MLEPGLLGGIGRPRSDRSRKPTRYPRHELEVVDDPADRKPNGRTEFPAYLQPMNQPADAPMPGCRTPIPSKGIQRIGALFCKKRSIETRTAVTVTEHRTIRDRIARTDLSRFLALSKNLRSEGADLRHHYVPRVVVWVLGSETPEKQDMLRSGHPGMEGVLIRIPGIAVNSFTITSPL